VKFVTDEQGDDEADVHVCCLCKAVLLFQRTLCFVGKIAGKTIICSKALSCICRVLNCKFIAICVETMRRFFIFLGCVSHPDYYKGALYLSAKNSNEAVLLPSICLSFGILSIVRVIKWL